ncbi:MAG: AAA family ATPase [Planctomycetia bacterium]
MTDPFDDAPPFTPAAPEPSTGDDLELVVEPDAVDAPPAELVAPRKSSTTVADLIERLRDEVAKVYLGQDDFVRGTLVALFSGGHVLIESVPGLGKTLLVRVLSKILGCKFHRIQFTADLMPSDLTGQPIFDLREQQFQFRPGPVFTQLLLADEINRSPAKTHAALLEIMQERRVTVDGVTYPLEKPFIVLATQNPVESEGTYNLPEAQLDRFMFKVVVEYPTAAEEADVLRLHCRPTEVDDQLEERLEVLVNPTKIIQVQDYCRKVRVDDKVIDYINAVVRKTRTWPDFHMGASPRAGISLLAGARTLAAFNGRRYVTPDDVAELALPALRHRVVASPEAEVEGRSVDDALRDMLRTVEVPRL